LKANQAGKPNERLAMPDISKIKRVSSLNGTNDKQLNFIFFNQENNNRNLVDFSKINHEKLVRLIVELVNSHKRNNYFSEIISESVGLIKNSSKSYKDFEAFKEIQENSEYIFCESQQFSTNLSKADKSAEEHIKTLNELAKLGVFNV
jgi:hypothetical protein